MYPSLVRPLALLSAALSIAGARASSPASTPVAVALPTVLAGATLVGHVPSSTVLSLSLSLAPTNRASLIAYSNAVNDPRSPVYHHFLTPAQVGTRFGASATTVNAAVSYLKSKGLTVTLTAKNHMAVLLRGTVASIEGAFSTKINNYKVASRTSPGPLAFYSPATVPKVPASFAAQVVTIDGLTNANPPVPATSALRPVDARSVYDAAPLYDGTGGLGAHKGEGVRIGVTNFSGYRLSNAKVYADAFGLPLPGGTGTNLHKVIVGGVDGETAQEGAEGDLDFQMVLATAPKADVYLYDGLGGGLIAVLAQEADDNLVDIATESYGFGAGDDFYTAAHDQHLAMTAQGITYLGASGDTGTSWLLSVPYPGFDPDVLMVGGSDVTLDAAGNRGGEIGWTGSGSGWYQGGIAFNALPPYQVGDGVPTNVNHRLEPDVALHATNWYFAFGNSIGNVGGTSAATPSFAGQLGLILQALKEQGAVDPTPDGHYRLGRIQDFVYPLVAGGSDAFYDITQLDGADAGILPDGTASVAKPGWDFVTGLGAPDDARLYAAYLTASSVAVTSAPTSTTVFAIASPRLTLGTAPAGDATSLAATDGTTYSLQSVTQPGVGQVAAVAIAVPLQTAKKPRSATVEVTFRTPTIVTGTLYLLNSATNAYDLVDTVAGTGAMNASSIPLALDDAGTSPYINAQGTLTVLVRGLKPTRLGATPFRLVVDQATVTERVVRG